MQIQLSVCLFTFLCDVLPLHRDMFRNFLRNYLWNVSTDVLNSVVVSYSDLSRHYLYSYLISIVRNNALARIKAVMGFVNIVDDFLLVRNVLNPAVTFHYFFFISHLRFGDWLRSFLTSFKNRGTAAWWRARMITIRLLVRTGVSKCKSIFQATSVYRGS